MDGLFQATLQHFNWFEVWLCHCVVFFVHTLVKALELVIALCDKGSSV